MINAKDEFLEHAVGDGKPRIKCVSIQFGYALDLPIDLPGYKLPVGYSDKQMAEFCSAINFDYDDGFGGQELYGTIWYEDGTFSQRGEYDGSEWWEYMRCPEIPNELQAGISIKGDE